MPVDVSKLVAGVNFAPAAYQSAAPDVLCNKHPIARSSAIDRVLALPRRPVPSPADFENLVAHMTAMLARPPGPCRCREIAPERFKSGDDGRPGPGCVTRFRGPQAWALWETMNVGGCLGVIAVGAGKTFLNLAIPLVIAGGARTVLLLVPSNLMAQLVEDYHLFAQHFRVPSLILHGSAGRSFTVPGMPAVHVLPYSLLSRPNATSFIESLRPDLIIADECDKLRDAGTATTARVLRYFEAHPETRFCGWSGSVTDSSLHDYAHLAAIALKERSPLPLPAEGDALDHWAEAIDAIPNPRPGGALMQGLLAAGFMNPGEHIRDGYRRRFHETPGIVYSADSGITVELVIKERPAPTIPVEVQTALDRLRATWQRPDGEELVDALSMAKCARELACGFFYRWIFPRREPVPLILEWLEARKEWHKELRTKLKKREEHLDSEMLCTNAARRAWGDIPRDEAGLLPVWKAYAWPRWRDVKDKVDPVTNAVRIHDYLARDAAQWAHTHRGIVWYDSVEFGQWVTEISGLPMHGGGPKAGTRIKAEDGSRSIIASLKSHGRGRNGLQFLFADNLLVQPPSSASMWEQFLGRTHRPGQKADRVSVEVYQHTPELKDAYEQALDRAAYVEATVGTKQKILFAL